MVDLLVTGGNGQLGRSLQTLLADQPLKAVFTDIDALDITNAEATLAFFEHHRPKACINCAAYTAVDKAENDREHAFLLNSHAAGLLAQACQSTGTALFHVSTDFVFNGTKSSPYTPDDATGPLSVYGQSKLEGEKKVLAACPTATIVRTSWLYSVHGNNFVKTMLRLGSEKKQLRVVADQAGTPTFANDLARFLLALAGNAPAQAGNILHFSNEGIASWYDLAHAVFSLTGIDSAVEPIPTGAYPTPAKRPAYSVLCKEQSRLVPGYANRHWQDALKDCLTFMETLKP